ncbi:MAG: hypothetical protein QOI27_674, partial [Gaiellaceae bacterium]|nr:hypothetical protein [Gaiellaceae bacterium]
MTDVEIDPALIAAHDENADRCMCQSYLRSTERAALA